MFMKVLGIIDILLAFSLLLFLKTGEFQNVLIFFVVLVVLKSFLTIKDFFSFLDLIASVIIVLAIFYILNVLVWLSFIWFLFKGLFSLLSSV